jgi:hypothetical protein
MHRSTTIPLTIVLIAGIAAPAQAQLAAPSCPALVQWAEGHVQHEGWRPNALTGRAVFSALLAEDSTTALFGKPVLEWTAEEAQALGPVLQACATEQQRARNQPTARALNTLRTQITRDVPRYLAALAEARRIVPRALETIESAEASLPLLHFYLALADVPATEAHQHANQFAARQPQGPGRDAARALVAALRDLPEAEMGPAVHPAAEARIPALRRDVRAALVQEIEGVETSANGLRLLDRHAQIAERDYAAALGAAEMRAVEAAIIARRATIGEGIRDDLIRQAGETPLTPQGFALLGRFEQQVRQQHAATIGEVGVAAVAAAIATRRGEIGGALRDQILRQIEAAPLSIAGAQVVRRVEQQAREQRGVMIGRDGLETIADAAHARIQAIGIAVRDQTLAAIAAAPATRESLARLAALAAPQPAPDLAVLQPEDRRTVREAAAARQEELAGAVVDATITEIAATPLDVDTFPLLDEVVPDRLTALLPEPEAERLRAAAAERRRTLAATLLPQFRQDLAALPQTDEALVKIDEGLLPALGTWPESATAERALFEQAAKERREAILAAVNRAQAGPLRGRTYEGPFAKVEFIDAMRVIATAGPNPPTAGTYEEIDGGRVIVSVNNDAIVFTREGARLVSGPIVLHRVR